MSRLSAALLLGIALSFTACEPTTPRLPVIGEAYVGPASLTIRKDILPKSGDVAVVHFPDKVKIVQQHRHQVKVRTVKGLEGWTDERMLLDEAAYQAIQQLSQRMKGFPSQGEATTNDLLNVHTEPQRLAPSYIQIQPNERVDVLAHKLVSKTANQRRRKLVLNQAAPQRRKKEKKAPKIPIPPAPAPPKPPPDWVKISKERDPEPDPLTVKEKEGAEPAVPEDWTLVRNKAGESGWVLTRLIFLAIPDEVAQYAEGKRITSYFSLGKVHDEDKVKDIWLWTTMTSGIHNYDFDSFRVFIWSLHHHRYETAYIERRVTGYYPVSASKFSFSLLLLKEDGKRYRESFSMDGNRVKYDGDQLEPQ